MPLFEFVLFALLGWCVFVPGSSANKVVMIIFIVLMVVWIALSLGGYNIGSHMPRFTN